MSCQRYWVGIGASRAQHEQKSTPGRTRSALAAATSSGFAASDPVHATFVFGTSDADRLNTLLLLVGFRREAIGLPGDRLGRWAAAVRTRHEVAELRSLLVARVVHTGGWDGAVRQALGTSP